MMRSRERIEAAEATIHRAARKSAYFANAAMMARDFGQWGETANTGLNQCQEAAAYWAMIARETRCNLITETGLSRRERDD